MKKIFCILLIVAMLFTMCACGRKEKEHPVTKQELEEILIGDTETSEEASEPAKFWLCTLTGEKKSFEGTLFGGQAVPVNLERFDEKNQPYCWGPNGAYTGQTYDHLTEILHSDDPLISYWENGADIIAGDILPQTIFDEKSLQYVRDFSDPDHIDHIYLLNLSREAEGNPPEEEADVYLYQQCSAKDCYEKGWWYIQAEPDALDLEYVEPSEDYYTDTQLAALWDRLGAPDYVRTQDSTQLQERLRENSGDLAYELVYQYDDFVLSISVKEAIVNSSGRQKQVLMLTDVKYYTPECWSVVKDELDLTEYSSLVKAP